MLFKFNLRGEDLDYRYCHITTVFGSKAPQLTLYATLEMGKVVVFIDIFYLSSNFLVSLGFFFKYVDLSIFY